MRKRKQDVNFNENEEWCKAIYSQIRL